MAQDHSVLGLQLLSLLSFRSSNYSPQWCVPCCVLGCIPMELLLFLFFLTVALDMAFLKSTFSMKNVAFALSGGYFQTFFLFVLNFNIFFAFYNKFLLLCFHNSFYQYAVPIFSFSMFVFVSFRPVNSQQTSLRVSATKSLQTCDSTTDLCPFVQYLTVIVGNT